MSPFRADLHCHSTFSDGTFTPEELLQEAKVKGLQGLSITDHDTTAAYSDKLFELANFLEIKLLPGVEISSYWKETTVHILGYGFDLNSDTFQHFLEAVRGRRQERNKAIMVMLQKRNIPITFEELCNANPCQSHVLGRVHIAQLMLKNRYVRTLQEAFDRFLADHFLPSTAKFELLEVIEEIHKARGKAILAHPHHFKKERFIKEVLTHPFDGIEGYCGRLLPNQEKRFVEEGQKRGWIVTGGSDFHGDIKPYLPLGCSWVSEEVYEKLCSSGGRSF